MRRTLVGGEVTASGASWLAQSWQKQVLQVYKCMMLDTICQSCSRLSLVQKSKPLSGIEHFESNSASGVSFLGCFFWCKNPQSGPWSQDLSLHILNPTFFSKENSALTSSLGFWLLRRCFQKMNPIPPKHLER